MHPFLASRHGTRGFYAYSGSVVLTQHQAYFLAMSVVLGLNLVPYCHAVERA